MAGGARIAEGALITEEVSYKFTPTLDRYGDTETNSFVIEQEWSLDDNGEGIYGGGEYQNGIMEYSTTPIDLVQFNTEAVVPFFASTKGYGILWDNNARSILNPPSVPPISVQNGRNETKSIPFVPAVDGDYIFYVNSCSDYGCGMNHYLSLAIVADNDPSVDTQTIQYWDELTNLPDSISGRAKNLVAKKKYTVFFQSSIENVSLYAITPFAASSTTSLRSRLGSNIDYYFVWQPTRNSLGGDIAGNSSTKPGIAMGGVEGSRSTQASTW